jgi:signal transduction histidine kinase
MHPVLSSAPLSHKAGRKVGTGLGLTFCPLPVEEHRGRILVESEQGRGSTFHFAVPCPAPRD